MADQARPFYYGMDVIPEVLRAGIYHNLPGGIIDHSTPQQGYLSTNYIISGSCELTVSGPTFGGAGPLVLQQHFGHAYLWREGDVLYGRCGPNGMVSVFARFRWPGWQARRTRRPGEIVLPQCVRITLPAHNEMRHAYHELIEAFLARRPGWQEVSGSYLRLILSLMHAEVVRTKRPRGQPANVAIDRRLRLATEFMEGNLAKPLAISDIAQQASLSEDYFRRLFSRQLGMQPVRYLKQLRVKEARRLFSDDPRLSVGEVARMAGFQDERYFARVFKAYYGIPPSQYRASLSAPLSVR